MSDIVERLRKRTKRTLPDSWKVGRKCPDCGAEAPRQKCMWDMGPGCPRNDPSAYDESPYVYVPDTDCTEAADTIDALRAQPKTALDRETATTARYDARIAELEVENARLRVLVQTAYNEGFSEGMREHTSHKGGKPWMDSRAREALKETK